MRSVGGEVDSLVYDATTTTRCRGTPKTFSVLGELVLWVESHCVAMLADLVSQHEHFPSSTELVCSDALSLVL